MTRISPLISLGDYYKNDTTTYLTAKATAGFIFKDAEGSYIHLRHTFSFTI
jgi:hypothetical protein